MPFAPLATFKHRIQLGAPLPFNIRTADHALLLARGQVIRDDMQLEALFDRGALVDTDDLRTPADEVNAAPPEQLPALWAKSIDRVGRTLRAQIERAEPDPFIRVLDEASKPVLALVERDPDLAIFQVVRQEVRNVHGGFSYGVSHSVHAAIACHLVARRLGWPTTRIETVFKAALTMNIAMLELQTRLAEQFTPLTAQQREAIRTHPTRGVELLAASGIRDEEWLDAVEQHHEVPGGTGYPNKLQEVGEMASLLRRVDVYTAKLSGRVTRGPLAANQAGRDLFMQDSGSAMTAAIVKEFGIYPPGCFVKMASGEGGVVVSRGATANGPLVAALTNRRGEPLAEPVRRDTASKEFAIASVVSEASLRVRVSAERLVAVTRS